MTWRRINYDLYQNSKPEFFLTKTPVMMHVRQLTAREATSNLLALPMQHLAAQKQRNEYPTDNLFQLVFQRKNKTKKKNKKYLRRYDPVHTKR